MEENSLDCLDKLIEKTEKYKQENKIKKYMFFYKKVFKVYAKDKKEAYKFFKKEIKKRYGVNLKGLLPLDGGKIK